MMNYFDDNAQQQKNNNVKELNKKPANSSVTANKQKGTDDAQKSNVRISRISPQILPQQPPRSQLQNSFPLPFDDNSEF
ncbi:MAG: hypothetical protein EZS28_009158 [Streblomastix strix]|uniref:Uncharacterized protein n=1 Tax=Streblomastix strix TaxID=222440 RepID=A0A5J4WJV3_9EUKA|nr:MAG: hypothetical protein EZS28_009158 [Streblomastix strix]